MYAIINLWKLNLDFWKSSSWNISASVKPLKNKLLIASIQFFFFTPYDHVWFCVGYKKTKTKPKHILQEELKTEKEVLKKSIFFSEGKKINTENWIKCSNTQLHVPVLNIKDVL